MEQELRTQTFSSPEECKDFVLQATQMLIDARETEPLLRNGMKYAKSKLNAGASQTEIADAFAEYYGRVVREEEQRPLIGSELINDGENIVTHCHS